MYKLMDISPGSALRACIVVLAAAMGALLALVWALSLAAQTESFITITVDTTVDDHSLTDCNDAVAQDCSLRGAITKVNNDDGVNIYDIRIPPGTYELTVAGANEDNNVSGDLDILGSMTLIGDGPDLTIINAKEIDRVLHVHPGVRVVLRDLRITGGDAAQGGGLYNEFGHTSLNNVSIVSNSADDRGGGIANAGEIAVLTGTTGSVIQNNGSAYGGGISNVDGQVVLLGAQVLSNNATLGGGIANAGSTATLRVTAGSTIGNNMASKDGGGLLNDGGGQATLGDVQVISNTAQENGGGVHNSGGNLTPGSAILTVTAGSLIQNNMATLGGGIYNRLGQAALSDVEMIANTASSGGAIYEADGAVTVAGSCIVRNRDSAVHDAGGAPLDAAGNWWGAANGPSGAAAGYGDSVSSNVTFAPFLTAPILGCPTLEADLVIAKRVAPAVVLPGQAITYTVTYTNAGPDVAYNVVLADRVPENVTAPSYTSSGAAVTPWPGETYVFTVSNLAPGAGGAITVTGVVDNSPTLVGTEFTNTATITSANSSGMVMDTATVTVVDAPISGLAASNDGPTAFGGVTTLSAVQSGGTNVSYAWDFGDGTNGMGNPVSHQYAAVGTYTATVTVSNSVGTETATTQVTVVDTPISGLSAVNDGPTVLGGATTLSATIAGGSGMTYAWDFGDGASGSGNPATHTYAAVETYSATVTVSNSVGSESATTQVTVVDVPIAGLIAHNNGPRKWHPVSEASEIVRFSATIAGGTNVSYVWDFGDGNSASGNPVTHVYHSLGNTAKVTASNGVSTATATTTVELVWDCCRIGNCLVECMVCSDDETATSRIAAAQNRIDRDTFYAVRDQILAGTPTGRHYIELFYTHSPEIVSLLQADVGLLAEAIALTKLMQPALRALVDGEGTNTVITAAQVTAFDQFFANLNAVASPALQQVLAEEFARLPPIHTFAGKTMAAAHAEIAPHLLFMPAVRQRD